MKDCFFCIGKAEPRRKNHVAELDNCEVIVKNVPSFVCKQCGASFFTDKVMQDIETIIGGLKNPIKGMTTIEYADNAANLIR